MLRIKAHDVFEQNEFRAFSLISKVFKKTQFGCKKKIFNDKAITSKCSNCMANIKYFSGCNYM